MVDNKLFTQYVSLKREGSAGQQKKALQMFTSRKNCQYKNFCKRTISLREGYDKKVLRDHAAPRSYYV